MRCTRSVLMRIKRPFKIARPHIVHAKLFQLRAPRGLSPPRTGAEPQVPPQDGRPLLKLSKIPAAAEMDG